MKNHLAKSGLISIKKCAVYCSIAFLGFIGCNNGEEITPPDNPTEPLQLTQEELKAVMDKRIPQDNAFAFDLFKKINEDETNDNVFISPISISIALGMTLNGADGETKRQMENVLHLAGLSSLEINEYYRFMLTSLINIDPNTTLNFANSIWYKLGFPIHPDFKQTNIDYFNAEVTEIDFAKPEALSTINNWCSDKTNGLIKEPLDFIPGNAIMYLINAIYFKGIWEKEFDEKYTCETYFTKEDGTRIPVNMMQQSGEFEYAEDEQAQYMNLPYGNNSFSMTMILPKESIKTDDVIAQLTPETFAEKLDRLKSEEIDIYIPRFKLENKYELQDILADLGMPSAFNANADFSRMQENDSRDLSISRVIHGAFVEVNEVGTEAAGVTIVEIIETAMPDKIAFRANKPFIFVIRENTTGLILFMGKINEIEKY